MLHRVKKKNDINAHKWIGVGGKFEENESPDDCLLREVYEETGLTLTNYRYRGIITFILEGCESELMHLFTADGWQGTLHECNEGNLQWVAKAQVPNLPIWEGDKLFLKLLADEHPFFSLKLVYQGDRLMQAVLDGKTLSAESL